MSTRELERELAAVLHRHAEDAMNTTDTQAERERFYDAVEVEPRVQRRGLVVAVAVAAAAVTAVTAVVVVSTVRSDDGTAPPPTNNPSTAQVEREAELLADRVVAAYADHDLAAVTDYLSPGPAAWPGLRLELGRNDAFGAVYLTEACVSKTATSIGLVVECPFDMHVFHSEELGAGPFEDNYFSMLVDNGTVTFGETTYNFENNGMGEYTADVATWVEQNYPEEAAFLGLDEPDVPRAQWDRWLRLWEEGSDAYLEAMTSEGNG